MPRNRWPTLLYLDVRRPGDRTRMPIIWFPYPAQAGGGDSARLKRRPGLQPAKSESDGDSHHLRCVLAKSARFTTAPAAASAKRMARPDAGTPAL